MDFLVTPLFFAAFALGVLTVIGVAITAWQRDAHDVDTTEWSLAYARTNSLIGLGLCCIGAMTLGSYLDHRTPSFQTAYRSCLTATNGNQQTYPGTINRQSSCVVIAREVIKSSNQIE